MTKAALRDGPYKSEKDVKKAVKGTLDESRWKHWSPVPIGYGQSVVDIEAVHDGVFLVVETKFHPNTPTDRQKLFLRMIQEESCLALVVNQFTVGIFHTFISSFEQAKLYRAKHQEAPAWVGAALLDATKALTEAFQ